LICIGATRVPPIEEAVRNAAKKPTGELTKADLEKVTRLHLRNNKLTEVPKELEKLTQLIVLTLNDNKLTDVKELEKLTKLEQLDLYGNRGLTIAQLDQLKKALPKCNIGHSPVEQLAK
jgi:Leucine-rich repeat (LRR) protein